MQDIVLSAAKRTAQGKAVQQLRQNGLVPGIIYGQGKAATPIQAEERALEKIYHQAGTNRLVSVNINEGQPVNTLFYDVQHDVVANKITHFDLYTVRMDEKIETEIPIHVTGESPAVFNLGGVLLRNLESIEIKALPANLPENFTVDISNIDTLGQNITVADLEIPKGVEILTDAEEVILVVKEPVEEEIEEELPPEGSEADLVESEHGGEEKPEDEASTEAKE